MTPWPRTVAVCVLATIPAMCRAEAAAPTHELGMGILQMLAGLAVVVGVIFASLWLLKKLAAPRAGAAGVLRVVGGTAVGARERVVLVEVGETWLVLGVAPGRVNMLHQLARREPVAMAPSLAPTKQFGTWLQEFKDRRNAPP